MSFGLFSFILSGMYFLLVKTRLFIVYVPLFLCKANNVSFDLTNIIIAVSFVIWVVQWIITIIRRVRG